MHAGEAGARLARLAAVLPMLLLLVVVAEPALGHEEHGEGIPSPTPAYMVIPVAAWGAIITIGRWALLWRRTDTGRPTEGPRHAGSG